MPRYLTSHTLACLTRQGAQSLAERFFRTKVVQTHRVQVSMIDGKMLVELDAASREGLEAWLNAERFHYDWIIRIELESDGGAFVAVG